VASIEEPDGSTVFTDYDGNYLMSLSDQWIVIPFTPGEIAEYVATVAQQNPELAAQAAALALLDANTFRMVALNKDPGMIAEGFATNLNVTAFDDKVLASMPIDYIAGSMEEGFKSQGATILTQGVNAIDNANGIDVRYVDIEQSQPLPTGGSVTVLGRVILFKSGDQLVMLTVLGSKELGDQVFAAANAIGESVALLGE
jgi:hypothetical protein